MIDSKPPGDAPPPVLSLLAAILLFATGVYGAGFWLFRDRGPAPGAIQAAAALLRARHEPSDLIFMVPAYATRAREFLGDLHPLAVSEPLAEDLELHPRVWVFGLFGEGEALEPRLAAAGLERAERLDAPSGVTVDLYTTAADREVAYDFLQNLPTARVHHEKGSEKIPCAEWIASNGQGGPFGRWSCPNDKEWFYVAPEYHYMGEHQRFCFWAHPPGEGRLVIQFPNVPMTGHLHGRAGHTLNSSKHAHAPISLDVGIGEAPPQRFVFELEDYFVPYRLLTPSVGTATVTFAISTPNAGANHFCFTADMRRARSGAP